MLLLLLVIALVANVRHPDVDLSRVRLGTFLDTEQFDRFSAKDSFEASAELVRVIDADTIAVGNRRVRLSGVAAPEKGHPSYVPGRQYLGRLIRQASTVRCYLNGDRTYNREAGRCYLDGTPKKTIDIQSAVISAGYARSCFRYGGWRYLLDDTQASRRLPLPGYCW